MKRRSFFKDISFAIIATLVPKVLQPAVPEVVEELVEVKIAWVIETDYTNLKQYPLLPSECLYISKAQGIVLQEFLNKRDR